MALTPEQQAQVDLQEAITLAQSRATQIDAQKNRRLQCLNIAHTTLIENKRNLPIEQRQVTAAEISAFAAALEAHINA